MCFHAGAPEGASTAASATGAWVASATFACPEGQILGEPEVDCGVDAVGFEAHGHGIDSGKEQPATVLNSLMEITRAGGALGIPGLYVTGDPGAQTEAAKQGSLSIRFGLGWAKSLSFSTGQCPVMRYNRYLMQAILHDGCDRQGGQRRVDPARSGAPGVRGVRPGGRVQVRTRPERHARNVRLAASRATTSRAGPVRAGAGRRCPW